MSLIYLVRHGDNDTVGRLITGRRPGVHLNESGREQAVQVAERLRPLHIDHIASSPMERCLETAAPLARQTGRAVDVRERLNEIDFGQWSGLDYSELDSRPGWREFNTFRSGTRIPGGEMLAEVQARMVAEVHGLSRDFSGGKVAIFSHGDPIKTVLAYFLGFPLDNVLRLEVSPGSISILSLGAETARVLGINTLEGTIPH
ncbi:MAG: histidine phosphatase family protein [Desulfovibrionales bacterium]